MSGAMSILFLGCSAGVLSGSIAPVLRDLRASKGGVLLVGIGVLGALTWQKLAHLVTVSDGRPAPVEEALNWAHIGGIAGGSLLVILVCAAFTRRGGATGSGSGPIRATEGASPAPEVKRGATGSRTERWAALEADHDVVREEYGAYVSDVLAVLDRPSLSDPGVKETTAFLHAMDAAADARRGTSLPEYRAAVSELKTTWQAADTHARKTGLRALPQAERDAAATARKLLARALDGSGGEHERQADYRTARRLLESILILPREAVAELEDVHRLRLAPCTPKTP